MSAPRESFFPSGIFTISLGLTSTRTLANVETRAERSNTCAAPEPTPQERKTVMLIKSQKKGSDLPPEGEYPTELKQVMYKNENKKCILNFEITHEGKALTVLKDVPSSFDSGPLRKDLEILNGDEFSPRQITDGMDPETFIGRRCRALVMHKQTSGRRLIAVVNALLPLIAGGANQAATQALAQGTVQPPAPAPATA